MQRCRRIWPDQLISKPNRFLLRKSRKNEAERNKTKKFRYATGLHWLQRSSTSNFRQENDQQHGQESVKSLRVGHRTAFSLFSSLISGSQPTSWRAASKTRPRQTPF